jgi:hypothetical protein
MCTSLWLLCLVVLRPGAEVLAATLAQKSKFVAGTRSR